MAQTKPSHKHHQDDDTSPKIIKTKIEETKNIVNSLEEKVTLPQENIVTKVLQKDKKYRVAGVEGDLYKLEDLDTEVEWEYQAPTIIRESDIRNRDNFSHKIAVDTTKDFIKQMKKHFPFKVEMHNLLLAGGAVSNILLGCYQINDFDIFFYGLKPAEADKKIEQVLENICNSYDDMMIKEAEKRWERQQKNLDKNLPPETKPTFQPKLYETKHSFNDDEHHHHRGRRNEEDEEDNGEGKNEKVRNIYYERHFIRNKNCVTVIFENNQYIYQKYIIQLILRIYKTPSEILHGFDVGSSAVGFDGKDVLFTSLSKFSYEYMCNIVDTTRRSTTYEKRLKKYFGKGFSIVLPLLKIEKLPLRYLKYNYKEICDIPFFPFSYKAIQGNKIILFKFISTHTLNALTDIDADESTVQDSDYQINNLHWIDICRINIKYLLEKNFEEMYYFSDRSYRDVIAKKPTISIKIITDFYDTFVGHDTIKMLNLRNIMTYFTDEVKNKLLQKLVDKDCNLKIVVRDAFVEQKQKSIELFKTIDDSHKKIKWLTENPGQQLTSSFNPIIEEPEKWYGEYCTIKTKVEKTEKTETKKVEVRSSNAVKPTSSTKTTGNESDKIKARELYDTPKEQPKKPSHELYDDSDKATRDRLKQIPYKPPQKKQNKHPEDRVSNEHDFMIDEIMKSFSGSTFENPKKPKIELIDDNSDDSETNIIKTNVQHHAKKQHRDESDDD